MAPAVDPPHAWPLHPLHAVLLAGTIPPFLGALLSDLAYWKSHEIQWANFASWLIAGGLVFAGLVLAWTLVGLFRADGRRGRTLVQSVVMLAIFVLGFVNSLVHARDAWAAMPTGLVLSAIVAALAIVATWIGFSGARAGGLS